MWAAPRAALTDSPALTMPTAAILGRAQFYVLVIPTTLPGAFSWRNQGFIEHAREVGLVDMPQLGVVPGRHGPCSAGPARAPALQGRRMG